MLSGGYSRPLWAVHYNFIIYNTYFKTYIHLFMHYIAYYVTMYVCRYIVVIYVFNETKKSSFKKNHNFDNCLFKQLKPQLHLVTRKSHYCSSINLVMNNEWVRIQVFNYLHITSFTSTL